MEGTPMQDLTPAKPGGRGRAGSGVSGACRRPLRAVVSGLQLRPVTSNEASTTPQLSLSPLPLALLLPRSPLAGLPQARGSCCGAQRHRTGGKGPAGDCRERSAWGKREHVSLSTKNTGICPKKPRTGGPVKGVGVGSTELVGRRLYSVIHASFLCCTDC